MCCSMRATVFFLSSYHIWFAFTQAVIMIPTLVSSISSHLTHSILAIIYSVIFFCAGFLIFRGADQESTTLVGWGAVILLIIIAKRYFVMWHGLLLKPTLPEADFLNPYGVTVPIMFTVLLYVFYLSILFCYHNELKYSPPQGSSCILMSPLSCRRQFPTSTSVSLSLSPSGMGMGGGVGGLGGGASSSKVHHQHAITSVT